MTDRTDMAALRGTWFVAPTPFTERDEVDEASLAGLCEAVLPWGVDGITVLGVMGEVSALGDDERDVVIRTVAKACADRLPFAVGCSAAAPGLVVRRARAAEAAGAAAVMVSAPPLARNTDTLAAFYQAVGAGSGLPVIVQDEPNATGVVIPVSALLAALRACGSDVVKLEDAPTPPKISRLLEQDPSLTVFGGLGGVSAFHELARGSAGTMTGFAYPEVLKAVREAFEAGDRARARAVFTRYLPLIAFEGQPAIGVAIRKEVLVRRGVLATNRTRGLSPTLDGRTSAELTEVLDSVGLRPAITPLEVV